MNIDQLDAYIALLFERQAELGAAYVKRQVEWAESEMQNLLIKKSSSLSGDRVAGHRTA
jgi:hypothetical protein